MLSGVDYSSLSRVVGTRIMYKPLKVGLIVWALTTSVGFSLETFLEYSEEARKQEAIDSKKAENDRLYASFVDIFNGLDGKALQVDMYSRARVQMGSFKVAFEELIERVDPNTGKTFSTAAGKTTDISLKLYRDKKIGEEHARVFIGESVDRFYRKGDMMVMIHTYLEGRRGPLCSFMVTNDVYFLDVQRPHRADIRCAEFPGHHAIFRLVEGEG